MKRISKAIGLSVALIALQSNSAHAFDLSSGIGLGLNLINNVSRGAQKERELKIQAEQEELQIRAAEAQAMEAATEEKINAEVERRLAARKANLSPTNTASNQSKLDNQSQANGFMAKETNALKSKLTAEEQKNVKAIFNECKLRGFPEHNMWNRCMKPLYSAKGLALPRDPMTAIMFVKFSGANEDPLGALMQLGNSAGY